MFIEYIPKQSYIHSLDVRTKLFGFATLSFLMFLFENPLYNLVLAFCAVALAFLAGLPTKKVLSILAPLLPIYFLIVLMSGFSKPERFLLPFDKTVLFYLFPQSNIGMTIGGLLMGCSLLIRLLTMIIGSSLITLTTPVDDFIQLFNKMRLPYEFAFVITTALRFIPTINRKRLLIIDAQKSRGAKLDEKGIVGPIKNGVPIMVPMLTGSIMMANNLSKAMLNRGYGYSRQRTYIKQLSFNKKDYFACLLIILVFILGIYVRFIIKKGSL